jgi:hypothetical protein
VTDETDRKNRTSFEDMGRKLDDEVEKLISYLNDEVVPQVRDHSSRALRIAADKLARFADYMEERDAGKTGGTGSQSDVGNTDTDLHGRGGGI